MAKISNLYIGAYFGAFIPLVAGTKLFAVSGLCEIMVVSSSRFSTSGLYLRLGGCGELSVSKVTHGNTGNQGLLRGIRPSLLFLSIRLPSVGNVRLLRRLEKTVA